MSTFIIIIIFLFWEILAPALADGFSLEFEWIKSPEVSRTLLSILTDLNSAVVWMVPTHPHISNSSSPCTNPLVTILSAPITIGITVTSKFHSFSFPRQGPVK